MVTTIIIIDNILLLMSHPDNMHKSHTKYVRSIQRVRHAVTTSGRCIAQLAKMSIDPELIELALYNNFVKYKIYVLPLRNEAIA